MRFHILEKRKLRGEMARYAILATNDAWVDTTKKLVLFGCTLDDSYNAKKSLEYFDETISIFAFVDNDSRKWGRTLSQLRIISPQTIKSNPKDYHVIITADFTGRGEFRSPGGKINEQLLNYGFQQGDIDYLFECSCLDIDDFASDKLFGLFIKSMESAYSPPERTLGEASLPGFINSWFIAIEGWKYIYKWVLENHKTDNCKALEIGPGIGSISYCLKHLIDVDFDWIDVVDATPYMREKLGIKLTLGSIEVIEQPMFSQKFDFIIMAEVLEHLSYNHVSCLKKVILWLKRSKSARLYLTTPNNRVRGGERLFDSWKEIPDYKYGDPIKTDWGHRFEYYYEEILELFETVGLRVERYKPTFNGAVMSFELSLSNI